MSKRAGQEADSSLSSASKDVKNKQHCPCDKEPDGAVWVECSKCAQWYHCCCVSLGGLSTESVKLIKKWECFECFVPLFVGSDPERVVSLESRTLRTIVREELKAVSDSLKSQTEETVVTAKKEIIKISTESVKSVTDKAASTELAKRVVAQMDADSIERKNRECNIMIKNVGEWKTSNGKLDTKADEEFVVHTCNVERGDIESCFRAGKIITGTDGKAKPRPLIVKLKSKEDAMHYSKNGKGNLVESSDDYDDDGNPLKYWINLDLCRADRSAQFFVREERRKRVKVQTPILPQS